MQKQLESLLKKLKSNNHANDLEPVIKAFNYAMDKHKNQLRVSGEPFFTHPIAVANILADMGLDTCAVTAALLHDVVEDTDATDEEIPTEYSTQGELEDESFESEDVEEEQKKKVKKHTEPWYIARAKREADYYNW